MLSADNIKLVLSDLLRLHGYDFTFYSRESLHRRLNRLYRLENFTSLEQFRNKIQEDSKYVEHLVNRITVNVTEMFRDVGFFREIREKVLPEIADRPALRIWHAGCSTGEEVYSMAILLYEMNLLHKSTLYASDINLTSLQKAAEGVFPISLLKLYESKYRSSGGSRDFSSYYSPCSGGGKMDKMFTERMVFEQHNLALDTFLGKFDLIVCRNVVIYFERELQWQVFKLFSLSLNPGSCLALGEKETIRFSPIENSFVHLGDERIWKKIV